jgi:hypothetical protein
MSASELWRWFSENAARLHGLEGEELVREVYPRVEAIDDRLGVEVSTQADAQGRRELIITAYAARAAIPAVMAIVAEAPEVRGWKIIGLRPAMGFEFSLRNDKGGFDAKDLRFLTSPQAEGIRVRLLMPVPIDGMPAQAREQLAWQLVNIGLGEFLASRIDALELAEGKGAEGRPISELAAWIADRQPSDRDRHG